MPSQKYGLLKEMGILRSTKKKLVPISLDKPG